MGRVGSMKRVVCLGAGPAGLYAAILLRKALPGTRVEVYERNRPDDTFGWGVVFSDQTLDNFRAADAQTHCAIVEAFHHWDDIEVHFGGEVLRSGGHGFSGIGRKRLLGILQERAAALGAALHFQSDIADDRQFADADLIIGADGVNSRVRTRHAAAFEPSVDVRRCRYIWLGIEKHFDAFTFAFERTEHGWFQIHAYQFSRELSTVIVETREETWLAHGLDRADTDASIAFCERLFARHLGGARLQSNARHLRGSAWLNFNRIACRRWYEGRVVLIGDAAHTAHFSIGSGTKLAMEDAIALTRHVADTTNLERRSAPTRKSAVSRCSSCRAPRATRMEWFENVRAVREPAAAPVRLQPADGQPAHRARQPEAARPALRRGLRALAGRTREAQFRTSRCSCRSDCGGSRSRTA